MCCKRDVIGLQTYGPPKKKALIAHLHTRYIFKLRLQ